MVRDQSAMALSKSCSSREAGPWFGAGRGVFRVEPDGHFGVGNVLVQVPCFVPSLVDDAAAIMPVGVLRI